MRGGIRTFLISILILSVFYAYADDKTSVVPDDKSVKKESTSGDSDSKIDIRDDKKVKKKQSGKTEKPSDTGKKKKSAESAKKKSNPDVKKQKSSTDKNKPAKTGKKTTAKTATKADSKKEKSAGRKTDKKAESRSDNSLYAGLRDHVLNNRIIDVKKILANPDELKKYDLNRVNSLDDNRKTTLLADAMAMNNMDMAELLISAGADVNLDIAGTGTVLHSAAIKNNIEMIKFLLRKGALIEARDSTGNTPLLAALRSGSFDSARYLVMKGADSGVVNNSGSTAIHEAVEGGNHECVKLVLAQNRAGINSANKSGETPLYLAMKKNDAVLMRMLRDYGATDPRVTVTDPSTGELIEGTYTVREYGRKTPGYRPSADDTAAGYRYVFRRDGTGMVDMNDPSLLDMPLRWRSDGNSLIVEELDSAGYVTRSIRFPFLKSGGTVIFEKSDVQYGDVSGTRLEITRTP